MSEETKKAPAIRFQGFTDDWEQRKLEEDISVVGGATPSKSNPDYWNGPIVWLSSQEIKEKYVSQGTYTITKKAVDDNTTKMVKAGTPLIVSRSGILARLFPISIPTTDVAINQDIKALIFDLNIINTNFFVAQLQKNEDFILRSIVKTGTTVQSINMPDFYKLQLSFPSMNEQEKVGKFFQRLDDTIALHQRKVTLLKRLKEAYLTRMLPQNSENIPLLRFADFFEPWEQRKLGDTVQIIMGQSPSGENYTENPKDYILVQGNADMKNGRVAPRVWTTQVTKKADPEDIILSVRAPVGDVGKTDYPVVLGRGVAGIKGNAFIFQTLSRMKEIGFWTRYSSGSTFESINSADLKDAVIQIPNIEEQTKIGELFTKLDDTIALQQEKIAHLKVLKSTLLNKMFI